jgi:hypothetical protein
MNLKTCDWSIFDDPNLDFFKNNSFLKVGWTFVRPWAKKPRLVYKRFVMNWF